jgi:hypothetical protein
MKKQKQQPKDVSNLTFARFFSWTVCRYSSQLVDVLTMVFRWNRLQKPPLPPEVLAKAILIWLHAYEKRGLLPCRTDDLPARSDHELPSDLWDQEYSQVKDSITICTGSTQVVCTDRYYRLVPWHRNEPRCPECRIRLSRRWAEHSVNVIGEQEAHLLETTRLDWLRRYGSHHVPDGDYMMISCYERLIVISNQPFEGSTPVSSKDIAPVVEAAISKVNLVDYFRPVLTSESWAMPKEQPGSSDRDILGTRQSSYRLKQIAIDLGAISSGLRQWQLPLSVDQAEWERQFTESIKDCDRTAGEVFHRLEKLTWEQPKCKGRPRTRLDLLLGEEILILNAHSDEFEQYLWEQVSGLMDQLEGKSHAEEAQREASNNRPVPG